MEDKLLLSKPAVLWVNDYYEREGDVLLNIYRKDGSESYDVFIDKEDFGKVSKGQWYVAIKRRNTHLKEIIHIYYTTKTPKKCYNIHQWILDTKGENVIIDHIDRDRLNNRKSNLRFADAKINRLNQEFKGFYEHGYGIYYTCIQIKGKFVYSGSYNSKKEALEKYYKACLMDNRHKYSEFIKAKISENNISISNEDLQDIFIKRVNNLLNGLDINDGIMLIGNHFVGKGYNYDKRTNKYLSRICISVDGKKKEINLGRYGSEKEAEIIYLKANIIAHDNLHKEILDRIKEENIILTDEDFDNKYIQKLILFLNGEELPKNLNGKFNNKYNENMDIIDRLYKEGYSYHGISKYIKENIVDFNKVKGETIKKYHIEYLKSKNIDN